MLGPFFAFVSKVNLFKSLMQGSSLRLYRSNEIHTQRISVPRLQPCEVFRNNYILSYVLITSVPA